ncbi:fumarate hydratase [candidate division WOR-1 bacterium DG_54_3]|uniref:Fumarate hydratase n=1 Tax=candidate division WOR-1 bacterium DG_54_3 TaxID=1703775 RepID=A0A0S7Y4B0_UNCSA|nr:MAG: fumarate hydratase [candidate division WOR-1 bacterium DG_54_3]
MVKKSKTKLQRLKPPLTDKDTNALRAGDKVLISGKIFVARDAAHRLFGKRPPFDPAGAILYYASPTPARRGKVIGSIGPTTATRMDPFTPNLLKLGLKLTIGKGERSPVVKAAIKKYKAAYLVVPGGTAAALSKHIKKSNIIAFPDLGPEAVLELEVADFPAIVAIDSKGGDLFEQGKKKYGIK